VSERSSTVPHLKQFKSFHLQSLQLFTDTEKTKQYSKIVHSFIQLEKSKQPNILNT